MSGNGTQPFAAERNSMVESQLRHRGIRDERLLAAMSKVPRHEFVNEQNWNEAYADHPIPIAEQQTTSQPYMIAAMIQDAVFRFDLRGLDHGCNHVRLRRGLLFGNGNGMVGISFIPILLVDEFMPWHFAHGRK